MATVDGDNSVSLSNIQQLDDLAQIEAAEFKKLSHNYGGSTYHLRPFQTEPLNWENYSFKFPHMTRMGTYPDGSCMFHAIALSYFIPYRRGRINEMVLDRGEFIKELRLELSTKLGDIIDETDPDSPSYYQVISRGGIESFGQYVPQYTLDAMKAELASSKAVDNAYNEFISDVLNKDIYLLDMVSRDVYVTGDDLDILYKERPSIVLLYLPGHYELVGIRNNNGDIKTLFSPDHPFIQSIQRRLMEKISLGSGNQ